MPAKVGYGGKGMKGGASKMAKAAVSKKAPAVPAKTAIKKQKQKTMQTKLLLSRR